MSTSRYFALDAALLNCTVLCWVWLCCTVTSRNQVGTYMLISVSGYSLGKVDWCVIADGESVKVRHGKEKRGWIVRHWARNAWHGKDENRHFFRTSGSLESV